MATPKAFVVICWSAKIRLLSLWLGIGLFATFGQASEEAKTPSLSGLYANRTNGMYNQTLLLKSDGRYVFTGVFDIGSEEEAGTWTRRESVVTLMPENGKRRVTRCTWFRMVTVDRKAALSVMDLPTRRESDELSKYRLFIREKEDPVAPTKTRP